MKTHSFWSVGIIVFSAMNSRLVSAWTLCRSRIPTSSHARHAGAFSLVHGGCCARPSRDRIAALSTAVDISELIRTESESEMTKISDLFASSSTPGSTATGNVDAPLLLRTNEEVSSYVSSNFDAILFDCDGVLYRGSDPMPDAPATLQRLMEDGKRIFFVTNNAAASRSELKSKLEKVLHCEGKLKEEQMIGSAYAAGRYLRRTLLSDDTRAEKDGRKPRIHVVGASGLCREIESAGFDVMGGPDEEGTPSGMSRDELAAYPFLENSNDGVDAVVVGLDNDFNYRKLCIANVLLQRNPDAVLVATNMDAYDLVGTDARHLPGNGALVRAIECASGRTAINVGKPSPTLAELIMDEHGLDPARALMVGDRLDTDVKFGLDGGMKSALVLTGCAKTADIQRILESRGSLEFNNEEPMPSVIFPHVGLMCNIVRDLIN